MRKSSKMLSLVIALIFLFSAVTPALALSADAPDAGARLKALGIIEGYPDGSLGLDRTITRAEMAVVLAEMSGLGNASEVLKSVPSKFSDVATNVWYSGYVNLAANQSWVSGYPDGSFKPNANVTYAEAVTMMLNVLGYSKGDLPGTWPNNYLIKAAELGVTDDVSFATGSPALRGDVFVIASAALDQETVSWNTEDLDWDPKGTLLSKLNLTVVEDARIISSYTLLGSSDAEKEDREVTVRKSNGVEVDYKVAEGFDITDLVGLEADLYVNKDGKIVGVKDVESTLVNEVTTVSVSGSVYNVAFDGISGTYTANADTVVVINNELGSVTDLSGFKGDITYTRSSRTITSISIVDYGAMKADGNWGIVEDVVFEGEYSDVEFYGLPSTTSVDINLDDDSVVSLFGVDSLEDINEWDIVYYNNVGDDYAIYVIQEQVAGTLTRYRADGYVTIAGKSYDFASDYWTTIDEGSNWINKTGNTDLEDFSGEAVVALLNTAGDVVAVVSDVEGGAPNVALTISTIESRSGFGSAVDYRVELLKSDGTEVTYAFDSKATVEINGGASSLVAVADDAAYANKVVEFSLDSDGELSKINILTSTGQNVTALNEDDLALNRIKVGTTYFYAATKSVFFDISSVTGSAYDDAKVLSWDDVVAVGTEGSLNLGNYLYADNDGDIIAVVFKNALVAGEDYAVVVDWYLSGDDEFVTIVTAAGAKDFELSSASAITFSGLAENIIAQYSAVSGAVKLTDIESAGSTVVGVADGTPYSSSRHTISVAGSVYSLVADALVVDNSDTPAAVTDPSAIRRGDILLVGFNSDGLVEAIVILDKATDSPY